MNSRPSERARPTAIRFSFVADLAAVAVIVAASVAQFGAMGGRYLSPDEAFHVSFAGARDLNDVILGSRATPHPPLFFLLLHIWMRLGRSEFFLRLFPAICSALFLWFLYRWSTRLFGRTAGFLTLLLAALWQASSPLSSEVRGYSLLLFLSAAGLAEFESALESDSPARMAASFTLLFLAILTHYAAFFIVLSLAVYAPFRLRNQRSSRRVVVVWAAAQVGVGLLYLYLYLSHLRTFQESSQVRETITGSLSRGFFHRGQNIFLFLAQQSWEILRYLFGSPPIALVALVVALAGVGILTARRNVSAALLVFPPCFGAIAGLLGGYPFVGTRQCLYLLPFALAAIGVAFSAAAGRRPWLALLTTLILIPFLWRPPASGPNSLTDMRAALKELRRSTPPGSLILADFQTGLVLRYYFSREGLDDYRLVRSPKWAPDLKTFGDEVERIVRVHRLAAGQRFWVVRISSETDAGRELLRGFQDVSFSSARSFGDLLVVEVRL